MTEPNLLERARQASALAKRLGANEASAGAYLSRKVDVGWRDGKIESVSDATSRGLNLQLFVDGRYSAVSTSDLRPQAVEKFVAESIAMARALARDPHRALPDAALCGAAAGVDLQIEDPAYDQVTAAERRRLAEAMETAAREVPGAQAIVSVSTHVSDLQSQYARVHSNGFEGIRRGTSFWLNASASVRDPDGRRPEEGDFAGARYFAELPDAARIGRGAAQRALQRIGAKKGASGVMKIAVDNRCAGNLVSSLLGPLEASALQQKRSMFEGKLGAAIGNARLDIADDPLIPKGFGSQLFDGEGLTSKRLPLFEAGVLRNYYVDVYYGRKLGLAPTTSGSTNLAWKLGTKDRAALLADVKEGLLVTGFLGGNSNGTTGDFSLGVQGFRVRGGAIAEPVAEMNLSGNHLDFWKRLAAVGNDPWAYGSMFTPTLVFDGAQVAGT